MTDFRPVVGRIRRAGTGCITKINDRLFEGRYSPTGPTASAAPGTSTPGRGWNVMRSWML